MDSKLFIQALSKFLMGLLLIIGLIFIPAGSFEFYHGWIFICLLFVPMFVVGIILMVKNPDLLKKRLNSKEKESDQRIVVLIGGLLFLAGFITAGLNFRFKWYILPNRVVALASVIFFLSYLMYAEVLRENTYLSRTIEVQDNQKVIDTGLYGIVRHPMYSATIFMFLSIPLILGSVISFLILSNHDTVVFELFIIFNP